MPSEDNLAIGRAEAQTRPTLPREPSLEEQLQKAIDERRASGLGGAFIGAGTARTKPNISVLPIASSISERLAKLIASLRDVETHSRVIASALAGYPNEGQKEANATEPPPPRSIFEGFARALDEIDQIVDTIHNEQARARNSIG